MTSKFQSPLSGDLHRFLEFKRRLGYPYARAEATLAAFDGFLRQYVAHRHGWQLDQAMLVWLASRPQRKAVSVSVDASVLRQLCRYLRRDPRGPRFRDPLWPNLPTESVFVPYVLSDEEIHRVLALAGQLSRPRFRAAVYRMLIVLLYCTGLRFGEALRLRVKDVNTQAAVLFVELFKGRARWVPFHRSLSREFDKYLKVRGAFAPARPEDRVFIGANRETLPVNTASHTIRTLFRQAGLKPRCGRNGPRPYDLRHTFAVRRLTRWYRTGVDLHARLPWLSAYMGHTDILGTETYLTATPELLGLAGARFRRRYLTAHGDAERRTVP